MPKESYINKSVILKPYSPTKFPTWSKPRLYMGIEGKSNWIPMITDGDELIDNIWNALVVDCLDKFYQLLLTMSDGTKKLVWTHEIWVIGLE